MKKLSPKPYKKYIAIDLDGTILNSFDRHKILLDRILSNLDIEINTNDYLKNKLNGLNTIQYLFTKDLEPDKTLSVYKEWLEHIEDPDLLSLDRLYDDTIIFLKQIYKKYNLILISGRNNKRNAIFEIKKLKINKYFKKIIIVKPNTKIITNKLKKIKKYNCISIVGDTETEFEVAKLLKTKPFILNRGFRSKKYFNKLSIKTYPSLLSVLREIIQ